MKSKSIRIVNETGLGCDTKVMLGDTEIPGITHININKIDRESFLIVDIRIEASGIDVIMDECNLSPKEVKEVHDGLKKNLQK